MPKSSMRQESLIGNAEIPMPQERLIGMVQIVVVSAYPRPSAQSAVLHGIVNKYHNSSALSVYPDTSGRLRVFAPSRDRWLADLARSRVSLSPTISRLTIPMPKIMGLRPKLRSGL